MINKISINCHSSIKIKDEKIIYFDPYKIDKKVLLLPLFAYAEFFQKSLYLRIVAPEFPVQFPLITSAALGQNAFPESICGFFAEYALLLEKRESIRLEHFRPFVGIITCRITT